jgi:hypothetical protein
MGGFIAEGKGWRWTFWVVAIMVSGLVPGWYSETTLTP